MLLSLHIENIAVIERCDIEFKEGFNVLTGETGAGKSIIIDSINLLLGNKSSKNMIRTGCTYSFVSAVFTDFNSSQTEFLKENDIFPDDDGNVIISRRVTSDGRNIAKINGIATTVSTLKNISHILVNIHGQHDGSKILDPASHIHFLDEFANNSALIADYSEKFLTVKSIRSEMQKLTEIKERQDELVENLKFKIDQISKAEVKVGEYEKLKVASRLATERATITTALANCEQLLNGEETGILENISSLVNESQILSSTFEDFKQVTDRLLKIKIDLEDVTDMVGKKFGEYDDFELSPDYIEQRIYTLENVFKKFGGESETLSALEQFKSQLSQIEDNDFELERVAEKYKSALAALEKAALKLSIDRSKSAEKLSKSICQQLCELDMPNVRFEVRINRNLNTRGGNKYTPFGFDTVEFLISANAGHEPRPLSKIASGGELSRIMLCLKTILNSENSDCNTIVYDEVDSGVSGSTAQKIGYKLKSSADNKQVFAITHLAQIAALADNHYKVSKETVDGMTVSKLRVLDYKQRIDEVARIMGGVEISEQILKSAEELINNSKMC